MAHAVATARTIDDALRYLNGEWSSLADIERAWAAMDGVEREAFLLEWVGTVELRLREACTWAADGELSPGQLHTLATILDLVRLHRPFIASVLAEQ